MHLGVVMVDAKGEATGDQGALELLGCRKAELSARLAPLRLDGGDAGRWRTARIAVGDGFRTVRFSSSAWDGGGVRIVVADGGDFDGLLTHIRQSSRWRAAVSLMPTMTHGVRAPLNGIVVNLELLKELSKPGAVDDEQTLARRRRSLEAMERSVAGLRAVMESLTANLSEPAAEASARFDLREIAEEVFALTRPRATVQRATMKVEQGEAPVRVEATRAQIKHALLNLVLNALEIATPVDEIALGAVASDKWQTLWVAGGGAADDAPPLAAEGILGAAGDGVAVRLFVARGIAEAHGGELIVESTADRRERVEMRLPASTEGRNV